MEAHTMRRRGFTLVELLVVISIIIVLIALLLPAIAKAYKSAQRATLASDIQAVGAALEAYRGDMGDYPRVVGPPVPAKLGYDGAVTLCQALLAPGDVDDLDDDDKNGSMTGGAEKPDMGFRLRPGGKVYGPYLQPDRFKTRDLAGTNDPALFVLVDRNNSPILYFPAAPNRNVKLANATPGQAPYIDASDTYSRYDAQDNYTHSPAPFGPFERKTNDGADALFRIRVMLGDVHGSGGPGSTPDGVIQDDEHPVDLPYLLWSAGPDEIFGPDASMAGDKNTLEAVDATKCDDVGNFQQ